VDGRCALRARRCHRKAREAIAAGKAGAITWRDGSGFACLCLCHKDSIPEVGRARKPP
jgi:hypothetical protein